MSSKNKDILFYRVTGSGHPVIFLHGFLESSRMWDFLDSPNLIQKIVVDLPGHGNSFDAKENSTMKYMAELIFNLMRRLGIKNYTIVGHSMGGYVGLELMKMDYNCSNLVLLNSNFWEDSDEKVQNRSRLANIVNTNKEYFLYETIPNLFLNPDKYDYEIKCLIDESKKMKSFNIGYVSIAMSKRKNNKEFIEGKLDKILIIQGEGDIIVPKVEMDKNLAGLEANYFILKNSGHMAHIEVPIKTKELIVDFINKRID